MKKNKQDHSLEISAEGFKERRRSAEILGVFAKHNFYINGFTPEELRTTLEDLGPTYVKIGQIMSSRTDLLPESFCRELGKLRSEVRPLEAAITREVIEQETGKAIHEIYQSFRDEPLGSASIAQAHYGVLLDGTKVVTKVQRPLVADMMRKDFVLLKKMAQVLGAAGDPEDEGGVIDFQAVLAELEKVTEEELDFRVEAENTRQFRASCIEDETVVSCPTIIDELTTERILTMTYVDGYSISKKERVDADGYDRTVIAQAILDNYLHQVLDAGIFHGDPHQGNIMISHGVPYWIDFGMIGHVNDQFVSILQDIIFALIQKDTEALTNAALALGRANGPVNKNKLLEDVDATFGGYLATKRITDIDVGALLGDITAILNRYHITIPGEYTMLIRSLVTIEGVISEFCPEINFFETLSKKLIQHAKESFDLRETLASAIESLAVTGLNSAKIPSMTFDVLKNLVKGRLKINFELTGFDEPLQQIGEMLKTILFAIFACVLFAGSCTLCTTSIQPQVNGMPLVALIGFIVSIALALYTVGRVTKKK